MPKVLKIIGTIITIAALVVGVVLTGGGLAIGLPAAYSASIGFTAGLVGGISAFGFAAIGGLITTIGSALTKAPSLAETGAGDRHIPVLDVDAPGYYVFGETAVPLTLTFEQSFNNDEQITAVFAHAWHEISSYVSLHVDAELFTHSAGVGNGAFAGILNWRQNVGTAGQSALTLTGTSYLSTDKGSGIAHSGLEWNLGNGQTKYSAVPQKLSMRVIGSKMYDPRLDTSVGGSGSQDYDDPSTWIIPAVNPGNAALVALRYGIGEYSAAGVLIWGVGEPKGKVDFASFIAMANVADEIRDSVRRYELGGMFPTNNNHQAFYRTWEANTGGKISRQQGKRFIWLPHDDLISIYTITDADLVADVPFDVEFGPDPRLLVNAGRGKYISRGDLFQPVGYPGIEIAGYETEDGRRRTLPVDYSWIHDISTAERLTRMAIERSRRGRIFTFGVGWLGLTMPPFSVIKIKTVETNNSDVLVRVINRRIVSNGICVLTCSEEHADIYDDAPALGTPPPVTAAPASVTPADILFNATVGAAGAGSATMPGPGGQTTIKIERNKLKTGGANDGEIKIDDGWLEMPDDTIRAVAGGASNFAEDLFTTYESANAVGTPRDNTFYIISGDPAGTLPRSRFTTMTAGAAGSWGSAETDGFFIAEYDRPSKTWFAQNNLDEEEAFAPLITDMVFAAGKKALASTSIDFVQLLIPRATVAARLSTARNLREDLFQLDAASGRRKPMALGGYKFNVVDGGSVTFPDSGYTVPPAITWGLGGIVKDTGITENHPFLNAIAQNLSATGFDALLELTADAGGTAYDYSVGPQTTENGTGPAPLWQLTKDDATSNPGGGSPDTHEGDGGAYLFQFDVNAVDCENPPGEPHQGSCTVGCYTQKNGGSWTLRATKNHNSGTFNNSTRQAIASGLNTAGPTNVDKFGIDEESVTTACSANGLTRFDLVTWTRTPVSVVTATPGSVPGVRFDAYTNEQ